MININMKTVAKVLIAGFVIVGGTTVVAKSARIDTNTPLYFKGAFDATPEDYYILKDDKQNEYFINKKQIEDTIKRSIANIEQTEGVMTGDGYMNLAIKIDKKGNPEVLTAEEATKEENVIKLNNYDVKYTIDENKNIKELYVLTKSTEDIYVDVTKGYRILQDGEAYDVSKEQIVDAYNNKMIKSLTNYEIEPSTYGDSDKLVFTKSGNTSITF